MIGWWVARMTANIGARVDSDPSISPLSAGWTRVSRNDWVSMVPGGAGAVLVAMSESFRRGAVRFTADLEQFQPERLYLGQDAVQGGLVRQGAGQHRVLALCLGVQRGERDAHRPAKTAPYADLVVHRTPRTWLTRAKREIENRHRTASRIEKVSTAVNVPVNTDRIPTPTTGMIRPT